MTRAHYLDSLGPSKSLFDLSSSMVSKFTGRRRSSAFSTDSDDSNPSYGVLNALKGFAARRLSRSSTTEDRKNSIKETDEDCIDLEDLYRFDLDGRFPEFFVRKAEQELGETRENREKALSELKDMIKESGNDFRTDEFFLLAFLRVKKFETHRAFKLIMNFHEYKRKHHDLHVFDKRLLLQMIHTGMFKVLPYRDSLGRVVYINRVRLFNLDLMPVSQAICACAVAISTLLNDPVNQVSGAVVIMDYADISFKLIKHCTYGNTKLFLFLFLNALPIRYQAVHAINHNFLFKPIHLLVQKLSTNKMKQRFFFHGRDMKSLHKHVPPYLLPPEYGGTLQAEEIILNDDAILNNRMFS